MKYLVTGGEGFLGQQLCLRLVYDDHEVVSWDRGWFGSPWMRLRGVTYKTGDVTDIADLKGFDGVVHLANFSCDPMADYMPGHCFGTNVGGTFHVAKIAKRDGVPRFIFASTASVYGWNPHDVDENEPLDNVTSYYGMSKVAAERALQNLQSPDFSVACIRKGTLGGVSRRMRLDLMVNTMCMFARMGKITVSNPKIVRPHLDIRDAVAIYTWALERTIPLKGAYNAGYHNYTILEVAECVQGQCPCEIECQEQADVHCLSLLEASTRSTVVLLVVV